MAQVRAGSLSRQRVGNKVVTASFTAAGTATGEAGRAGGSDVSTATVAGVSSAWTGGATTRAASAVKTTTVKRGLKYMAASMPRPGRAWQQNFSGWLVAAAG